MQEFSKGLKDMNIFLSQHEEHALLRRFDLNGDGKVSMEEFYNGNFIEAKKIIENLENTHDNVIAFVHANFIRERIKETLFTLTNFYSKWSRKATQENPPGLTHHQQVVN